MVRSVECGYEVKFISLGIFYWKWPMEIACRTTKAIESGEKESKDTSIRIGQNSSVHLILEKFDKKKQWRLIENKEIFFLFRSLKREKPTALWTQNLRPNSHEYLEYKRIEHFQMQIDRYFWSFRIIRLAFPHFNSFRWIISFFATSYRILYSSK